jgi:uncharacterized protein (TIGR02594 family)
LERAEIRAMSEPRWLKIAERYDGHRRWPGSLDPPLGLRWWNAIRSSFSRRDRSPPSARFVDGALEAAEIDSPRAGLPHAYLHWGRRLVSPVPGCIVIFDRGRGTHVGIVVNSDEPDRMDVIGVFRRGKVAISAVSLVRVIGLRWPPGETLPTGTDLPAVTRMSRDDSVLAQPGA